MTTTTTPTLNGSSASDPEAVRAIALRSLEIMRDGTREDFDALIHPEAVNREAVDEPPASRTPGPAGHFATALWLRDAFGDVRWDVHDVIAQGDLAVVHCTMSGRHVRDFVAYGESGEVDEVFPPRASASRRPRRTGFASATGRSSSTGPTATTSAPRSSCAGCRPRRSTCCAWRSRNGGRAARLRPRRARRRRRAARRDPRG